jgi:hypothetical protein
MGFPYIVVAKPEHATKTGTRNKNCAILKDDKRPEGALLMMMVALRRIVHQKRQQEL